jgi:ribonuclease HI
LGECLAMSDVLVPVSLFRESRIIRTITSDINPRVSTSINTPVLSYMSVVRSTMPDRLFDPERWGWTPDSRPPNILVASVDGQHLLLKSPPPAIAQTFPNIMAMHATGLCYDHRTYLVQSSVGVYAGPRSTWNLSYRLPASTRRQTIPRTHLDAALRALSMFEGQMRSQRNSPFDTVIIVSESGYVVTGATRDIYRWRRARWMTIQGHQVHHRDLWQSMNSRLMRLERLGYKVMFWKCSRWDNAAADRLARIALLG